MFVAALFTIVKVWKHPKCSSVEEWVKKWYIYAMQHYSANKKNEIMPFAATWKDLEVIILSEVSQTEKGNYHMISFRCGISSMMHVNLFTEWKQTQRHRKQTYGYQRQKEGREWKNQKCGINRYKLLCVKLINYKVLLYSTRDLYLIYCINP